MCVGLSTGACPYNMSTTELHKNYTEVTDCKIDVIPPITFYHVVKVL